LPALTGIALRREHERLSRIAERILTGAFALAAIGGAFAAVAGPPVLAALFGNGSRPDALVAGTVGAGTVLAVGNLGLNQLLVAAARTHRVTMSWWLALIVAVAWVALGPGSVLNRVAIGFVIGEALAMLALTIASSPARAPGAVWTAVRRRVANRSSRRS
jgi:O-antigen/teichoic acid export membrane protein